MRVRMRVTMVGTSVTWRAGQTVDLDPGEAKSLVAAGYAELLPAAPEPQARRLPAPPRNAKLDRPAADR